MITRTAATLASHRAALPALALLSLTFYVALARLAPGNGWRDTGTFLLIMGALFAAYAAAFRTAQRADSRHALRVIVCGAVLFRLALVPAGLPRDTTAGETLQLLASDVAGREVVFEHQLLYDDDHWRYLWDGHVAASGADPFAYAPDDRRLDTIAGSGVWQEIREHVNHPWLSTIYFPLAQLAFRLLHAVAPASVVALKLAWIVADLAAMLLVRKSLATLQRPPSLLLLFAWNPLLIKVSAGSAHFDSLVALGVALLTYGVVRQRRSFMATGWVFAVATKLTPIVFFLPLARRLGVRWTAAAVTLVALLLAPMLSGGTGPAAFGQEWEFNATFYRLLKMLVAFTVPSGSAAGVAARGVVALAVIAAGVWAAWRFDGWRPWRAATSPLSGADKAARDVDTFADAALIPMAVLLLCGPVLMPWYLIWVLPLAAVAGRLFWFQLTAVCQLAFLVMVDGRERAAVLVVEALLFLLLAWLARCKRKRQDAAAAAEGATT